ncbi:unnamed protein product [Durusdinium trenchii]|uniref:Uncharacterized protein n=2 Tax=Durusdinium trenchii TaxID=1381693 RepID=A0ABP0K099_9DINO
MTPGAMDEHYMRLALSAAEQGKRLGEVAVGCVLVHQSGEVLAIGHNETNCSRNGTRHCEFVASEKVLCRANGPDLLRHSCLYVTLEPCIMCAAALQHLGVPEVVFGAANSRFGGCGGTFHVDKITAEGKGDSGCNAARPALRGFNSRGGILAEEAVKLLQDFYKSGNPNAPDVKRHRPLESDASAGEMEKEVVGTVELARKDAERSRIRSPHVLHFIDRHFSRHFGLVWTEERLNKERRNSQEIGTEILSPHLETFFCPCTRFSS